MNEFKNSAGIHMETLRQLDYLQSPGDQDVYRELIDAFFARVPDDLLQIQAAYSRGDLQKVSRTAHGLKSGAQILGALRFAEICLKLEHGAADGTHLIPTLQAEFKLVRENLEEFIKRKAP